MNSFIRHFRIRVSLGVIFILSAGSVFACGPIDLQREMMCADEIKYMETYKFASLILGVAGLVGFLVGILLIIYAYRLGFKRALKKVAEKDQNIAETP